jgi:hypothetical protein
MAHRRDSRWRVEVYADFVQAHWLSSAVSLDDIGNRAAMDGDVFSIARSPETHDWHRRFTGRAFERSDRSAARTPRRYWW